MSPTDAAGVVLRAATVEDVPLLPAIERAAGELFRPLGMDLVADDDPPDERDLRAVVEAGRAWVAVRDGEVAAYLLADVVDGAGHVEQVTVHPRHAGHRLGAALLERLAAWSVGRAYRAMTLTTYRDVPWNGPYYRARGFVALTDHELTPGLRALRAAETARGLDRWPREAMRRDLVACPPRPGWTPSL